jgi:tripartite-type tricarboxylate transporter receptor subunit TctC
MSFVDMTRRQCLVAGAAMVAAPVIWAQPQKFLSKPLRIIVPFPPGGGGDTSVRMVADRLSRRIGVPVVVDNKAGAEGILAVNELRNAAPDGHTIMFGTPSALLYVPMTRSKPPYDPLRDLQPVSHLSSFTYFLFVNDSTPVKNFAEYVAYVQAHAGKVAFGAGDATGHMVMTQMAMQAKLDMVYVPYKGTGQALQDFVGNRIQAIPGTVDVAVQLKDRARPIAVFASQRSPVLPTVPTMAELGFPQAKFKAWSGFFAPAKTPKELVDKLSAEFAELFKEPELQEYFTTRGSTLSASTPEELRELLVEQLPIWREAIAFAKVPLKD